MTAAERVAVAVALVWLLELVVLVPLAVLGLLVWGRR